jgi:putative endonuclease
MKIKYLNYLAGIVAEFSALLFLSLKFYRILHSRFKCKIGEIDLICLSPCGHLCFIEVKKRRIYNEETLTNSKIFKIKKTAEYFLQKHPKLAHRAIRFDYIEVNKFFIPRHHSNYF